MHQLNKVENTERLQDIPHWAGKCPLNCPLAIGADFHIGQWWRLPQEKTPRRAPPCEKLDPATIFFVSLID